MKYILQDKRNMVWFGFQLALYVLSFLEPKDLLRAAQTCRYWRILAEDNLLWREKCREEGITSKEQSTSPILPQASVSRVRRKSSSGSQASSVFSCLSSSSATSGGGGGADSPVKSQWKAIYMRQYQIEQNWRHGSVRPHKVCWRVRLLWLGTPRQFTVTLVRKTNIASPVSVWCVRFSTALLYFTSVDPEGTRRSCDNLLGVLGQQNRERFR